jgi:polar amino acid transport system substrate-binding protein
MKTTWCSIAVLAAALLLGSVPAATAQDGLDRIIERDELIVGMELGYFPFEYVGRDGEPTGFDVDLARMIAEQLGVGLVIRDMNFEMLIPNLDRGAIDAAVSAMTRTDARAERVAFTDPYFETGLCVLLNRERTEGVTEAVQLNDPVRIVTVVQGTDGVAAVDKFFDEAQVKKLPGETDAIRSVIEGRADAFVADQLTVWKRQQDYREHTRALLEPFTLEYFSIAVKPGHSPLLAKLNEILSQIRTSGAYQDLYRRYFGDMGGSF